MIKAEIVAHSLSPQGEELISVLATFPRIILAEVNTHRMLSKNTSSSRAIPFNKMVEAVRNNPFIPIAFQKHHSGMQGTEYFTDTKEIEDLKLMWGQAGESAVAQAQLLYTGAGVTKQLCNRLLEPFMWTTMLITGSKEGWENFFKLRCPQYSFGSLEPNLYRSKNDVREASHWANRLLDEEWLLANKGQAEIHIMDLAEKIWDARNESTPKQLKPGEWHIPFEDKIVDEEILKISIHDEQLQVFKAQISVAMAARTSYTVVGDEKAINYENMIALHDRLLNQEPPHSSPFEHTARAMDTNEYMMNIKGKCSWNSITEEIIAPVTAEGWCYNLKGFIPYRYLVDNKLEL